MAIAPVVGQAGKTADATFTQTSLSRAFGSNVSVGSLIIVVATKLTDVSTAWSAGDCTKSAGTATIGTISLDRALTQDVGGEYVSVGIWSALVTGAGSLTMRIAASGGSYRGLLIITDEYTGTFDGTRAESGNTNGTGADDQTSASSGNATSAGAGLFVGGLLPYVVNNGSTITEDAAWSLISKEVDGNTNLAGSAIRRIVSSGTTDDASWTTISTPNYGNAAAVQVYREVAAGNRRRRVLLGAA